MVCRGKGEVVGLVTTAVTSKDGHVITIAIQPFDGGSWFVAFAGPNQRDIEWARIFWGPRPGQGDIQSLKDHIEKRVQETGAGWKGWNYHSRDELPGTGRMN